MSDENKIIALGGDVDGNAQPIVEKIEEDKASGTLATPFETPAEAYIPTPTEVQKVVDKKPEQTKKKRGKVLKGIVIAFVSLIMLIVLTAGILFFLLIYDDMPKAPTEIPSTSTVIYNTVVEFATDSGRMQFSTSEINGIYAKLKPTLESAVKSFGAELTESFVLISDNKLTFYARLKFKGITFPVRITLKVHYEDPYACVVLDKITVGKFEVPTSIVSAFLKDVDYPENIAFNAEQSEFTYNTDALNDIFLSYMRKSDFLSGAEDFLDWGAGIFGGDYSYEDTFNITISECQIIENQLVFTIGKVFA